MVARSSLVPLCFSKRSKARLMQPSMPRPFECVDVVLVPFDDGALFHGGGFDRNKLVEPVLCQHEAARMLRKMTRRADELLCEIECETQAAIGEIEIEFLRMLGGDAS